MATKFFCENPDCENYHKSITMGKIRYQLREGKFVPETKNCPSCGTMLSYTEEIEPGPIKVNIGAFNGMNVEQKKEVLKKRMEKNNQKNDAKEMKEHYREKAIKNFFGER